MTHIFMIAIFILTVISVHLKARLFRTTYTWHNYITFLYDNRLVLITNYLQSRLDFGMSWGSRSIKYPLHHANGYVNSTNRILYVFTLAKFDFKI